MKENMANRSSKLLRRAVVAIVATGSVAASAAYSPTPSHLIVVPPSDLPELARQTGEAMLLHETIDGRTLLYIEQNQGARLAIFDVTDPGHLTGEGAVQLDAPGPFDFVSSFGSRAEIVRFRENKGDAVLDLGKADAPVLKAAQPQRIAAERFEDFDGLGDAKRINEQITNRDTGTTFLLSDSGLYVIRRPIAERAKERQEDERRMMYSGG